MKVHTMKYGKRLMFSPYAVAGHNINYLTEKKSAWQSLVTKAGASILQFTD